jgi:hypothetical protein
MERHPLMGRFKFGKCPVCHAVLRYKPAEEDFGGVLLTHQYSGTCSHAEVPKEKDRKNSNSSREE